MLLAFTHHSHPSVIWRKLHKLSGFSLHSERSVDCESNDLFFQRLLKGLLSLLTDSEPWNNCRFSARPRASEQRASTPSWGTTRETVLLLVVTRGRKRLQDAEKGANFSNWEITCTSPQKVLNTPQNFWLGLLTKIFLGMKIVKTERYGCFVVAVALIIQDYFLEVVGKCIIG